MYTVLRQVIFITCVQINSTDEKITQKNNYDHLYLGSKKL